MKTTSRYFSFLVILVFAAAGYAQEIFEDKDLPNFHEVSASILRGGQPKEAGIKELARRGVKTIVNLRGEGEETKNEERWARAAGINFINVSLGNWLKPETAQIDKILTIIEGAGNQPVFVHCKRGSDRTGTVIAAYRISHDNYTAAQAIDEAKNYGLGWWQIRMKDFINDYYRDKQKEK